jgi:hypothetical protein
VSNERLSRSNFARSVLVLQAQHCLQDDRKFIELGFISASLDASGMGDDLSEVDSKSELALRIYGQG